MRYDLYCGSLRIGEVIEENKDFPNLWGRIVYDESLLRPSTEAMARLARFIELTCDSVALVDVEHERDVSVELDRYIRELREYQELEETDDWNLVDDHGTRHAILCPVLRHGGQIVWCWNPRQ